MENADKPELPENINPLDISQEQELEIEEDLPSSQKFPALKPTRNGFMPDLDLDIIVDPGIDLLSQFVDLHKGDSKYNRKQLFESFYSLFCVLSYESLSETHSKRNSFEACQLLAIEYQNTCTTFHQEGYFQRSILKYFPAAQLPLVIVASQMLLFTFVFI